MIIRAKNTHTINFSHIFIVLLLFMAIFHPPLLRVNILYVVTPISWMYLVLHRKVFDLFNKAKEFRRTIVYLIGLILYQCMVSLANGYSPTSTSVGMIWWLIAIIPTGLVVQDCLHRRGEGFDRFASLLLVSTMIQVVLVLIAFVFPSVQKMFLSNVMESNYSSIQYMTSYRMYGFATYLTGFTPIAMGTIAGLFFYLGYALRTKYYFFVPFIALAAVVNARTALVVFVVELIVIFLFSKVSIRKKILTLLIALIGIAGVLNLLDYFRVNSENDTVKWIIEGIDVIIHYFNGETTGYFIYATNADKYVLPSGIQFILGKGKNVFLRSSDTPYTSDIGYVNDMWTGGIVFCILFYSFILFILSRISGNKNSRYNRKPVLFILLVSIAIANFKGIVNTDNDLMSLVLLLATFIMTENGNKKSEMAVIN